VCLVRLGFDCVVEVLKVEQRAAIKFSVKLKKTVTLKRLKCWKVYDEECLSRTNVFE